jgi:autotransporter-associated beta strand protein
VTGNISGSGGLTKIGGGYLTLGGTNSYSGTTTVSAGTLIAQNASALGSGNVTLNGGTLQMNFTGFFMFASRTVTQSAASKISITAGNQVNHAGTFNGGGFALTVGGGGTWYLGQLGNTVTNIPSISVIENTSLGDANNPLGWGGATISVANGSSVQVFGGVAVNNPLVLSGTTTGNGAVFNAGNGAVFNAGNGGATFGGAISLVQTSGLGGSFDYLVTGNVSGTGGLTKLGPSTITLSGSANTYTGATSVAAGKLLVASNLTSSTSVAISGGTLELAAGGGSNRRIRTSSLSITGSGKLDLQDNKLIVTGAGATGSWNGSAYTGVTQLIASGRNGNTPPLWDGSGIVTSQSNATGGNFHSIGVARASDVRPATATATASWGGQTITGTDTLVMYTYGGDATLDGKINIDDYVKIDSGIAGGLTGWSNGDFNYDGKVSIDDYITVIDANIGNQNGFVFPTASGVENVVAIPEPMSGGMTLAGFVWSMTRRRRHQSPT